MSKTASWKRPEMLLFVMAAAMPLAFGVWQALLNNFAIERASFTGVEIGVLQSLREIPGFLAFAVVFVLFLMREQTLAIVSLLILGIGTAITGYFPSVMGLYVTTVLMSIGFHYFETINQSLQLQWFDKKMAAYNMGRVRAIGSFGALVAFGMGWIFLDVFNYTMETMYVIGGVATMVLALYCWVAFPSFPEEVEQHKKIILRKRYWLYYALQFLSGARRQIFVVFAGFLMVEKFGFDAAAISAMFLINGALNMVLAPKIGKLIGVWGERRSLSVEYIGLVVVFVGYAFVQNPWVAVALYILDHLFFSMAIAMKTYFQKIADPRDMAPTAGVSFTINHIAAVVLPAAYGVLWIISPAAVFITGAGLAFVSLILSRFVPVYPEEGNEVCWRKAAQGAE
ncbi:Transporter, MFS superfamily [Candidatus Terasakiella magnetica]|uniref:Transporter, MFS superfamily n=1 Tax=Candidatus Terasakiella magnetica TaxID=1867952 RepID=A0A1C3RKY7_9PROT|nr:MFS transporter [Candidatus Terasakiella magnetica]SCA57915.1 Transporter, MFS superfamily [Candidatus Terasakiella magnetica]